MPGAWHQTCHSTLQNVMGFLKGAGMHRQLGVMHRHLGVQDAYAYPYPPHYTCLVCETSKCRINIGIETLTCMTKVSPLSYT